MRRRILSIVFLLAASLVMIAAVWKEVYQLDNSDKPRSALEKVYEIRSQAIADGNYPEILKAEMYALKEADMIDQDSVITHFRDINNFAVSCPDTATAAIAWSVMAELYNSFYRANQYLIEGRADIVGVVPDDMNEWSSKVFVDTVNACIRRSLEFGDQIRYEDYSRFGDLVVKGDDYLLHPTLTDILLQRAIQVKQSSDTAATISFYQRRIDMNGSSEAAMLATIDMLAYMGKPLDDFIASNPGSELVVYAIYKKAAQLYELNLKDEAYELVNKSIAKYSNNKYKAFLYNVRHRLEEPSFMASSDAFVYPGSCDSIKMKFANVDSVVVKLYRVNVDRNDMQQYRYSEIPDDKSYLVDEQLVRLDRRGRCSMIDTTVVVSMIKDEGIYRYVLDFGGSHQMTLGITTCSRYMVLNRTDNNRAAIYVVDRLSGEPQKNVSVAILDGDHRQLARSATDADGFAYFQLGSARKNYWFAITSGKDRYYPLLSYYAYGGYDRGQKNVVSVSLFTDRKIYRPGQEVRFKGVAYVSDTAGSRAVPNDPCTVTIYDSKGKVFQEKKLRTNEMGSFFSSFVIPDDATPGYFRIGTQRGGISVEVAEYKRPTFKVEFDRPASSYALGDTVLLTGRATYYNGMPVQNVKAAYSVDRTYISYLRCMPSPQSGRNRLVSDSVLVGKDGTFSISFVAAEPDDYDHCMYTCDISVVDPSGEMEKGNTTLYAGSTSMSIDVDIDNVVNRASFDGFTVNCSNLSGTPLTVSGSYELLDDKSKVVMKGVFTSGRKVRTGNRRLGSGRYMLKVSVCDDQDRDQRFSRGFIVYGSDDNRVPVDTVMWFVCEKDSYTSNEPFTFVLGSSDKAYMLYTITDKSRVIMCKPVLVDRQCVSITAQDAMYAGDITINVQMIRNGHRYEYSHTIRKSYESQRLSLATSTFRNLLKPGTSEQWRFTVKDPNGKPVDGEMLANMYDASLDKFAPNSYSMSAMRLQPSYGSIGYWNLSKSDNYNSTWFEHEDVSSYAFDFSYINMYEINYNARWFYIYGFGHQNMMKMAAVASSAKRSSAPPTEMLSMAVEESAMDDAAPEPESEDNQSIRSDFAETAFFYPDVEIRNGEAEISFVVPDAITEWKLMLLAHTRDMRSGTLTESVVARKRISVSQNPPRFVRQGDSLRFVANVQNCEGGKRDIKITWTVSDRNGGVISSLDRTVVLDSMSTMGVSVDVAVPFETMSLVSEVRISDGTDSDGERRGIDVLPATTDMVETLPFFMTDAGHYTYRFDSLSRPSATRVNRSLKIEFCANPAWYALTALPDLSVPESDNAIDVAIAYYAHLKSMRILKANPELTEYIRRSSSDSLLRFLDVNTNKYESTKLCKTLKSMQKRSGGFSWFADFDESRYITLMVAELLAEVEPDGKMFEAALDYLKQELLVDMKSKNYKNSIGSTQLRTLMLCKPGEKSDSYAYFLDLACRNWKKLSIADKARAAIVIYRSGDAKLAARILESVDEYAVSKPGKGMWWPKAESIEVESLMLRAYSLVKPDDRRIMEMQNWLVCNKQTNRWGNAVSSLRAIDALLSSSVSVLDCKSDLVVSDASGSLDGKMHESIYRNALYRTLTFEGDDINSANCTLDVEKKGDGLSWGAAYLTYNDLIDSIPSYSDGHMTISKRLLVERDGQNIQVADNDELHVGDKIKVVLKIVTDRAMDYVHISDMRASALEPMIQTAGYAWYGNCLGRYIPTDRKTDIYFNHLGSGTYIVDYDMYVTMAGRCSSGVSTVVCEYATEFRADTGSVKLNIVDRK